MYGFILLVHKVGFRQKKSKHVSMHYAAVVIFSVYITVCLWCCFIYFTTDARARMMDCLFYPCQVGSQRVLYMDALMAICMNIGIYSG